MQVTISAVDDQTLQTLHSRALYHGGSILWGHAFEVCGVYVLQYAYSTPAARHMLGTSIALAKAAAKDASQKPLASACSSTSLRRLLLTAPHSQH